MMTMAKPEVCPVCGGRWFECKCKQEEIYEFKMNQVSSTANFLGLLKKPRRKGQRNGGW